MFWDRGYCQWLGKGVVLEGPDFDMGWPLFFKIFEKILLIQYPEGFWGRGEYSTFAVPNLGIASPLSISLCFPQVYFLDRSGLLLGRGGASMLDSNMGMD